MSKVTSVGPRRPMRTGVPSERKAREGKVETRGSGSTLSANPLYTGNPYMDTLANCEDPDEMPQDVAFHQGLPCLLR